MPKVAPQFHSWHTISGRIYVMRRIVLSPKTTSILRRLLALAASYNHTAESNVPHAMSKDSIAGNVERVKFILLLISSVSRPFAVNILPRILNLCAGIALVFDASMRMPTVSAASVNHIRLVVVAGDIVIINIIY